MIKYRRTAHSGRARLLSLPGAANSYASTPDSAAADITGDIDIIARFSLADWTPGSISYIVAKFETAGQISYLLSVSVVGTLLAEWSVDGTNVTSAVSSVGLGLTDGVEAEIRWTLDVDNGAAGNNSTFYLNGAQLGSVITNAGVTSIFSSTSNINISGFGNGIGGSINGNVKYVEVRNGIGGSPAFIFNPLSARNRASTFTSSTGEVWTINGNAVLR